MLGSEWKVTGNKVETESEARREARKQPARHGRAGCSAPYSTPSLAWPVPVPPPLRPLRAPVPPHALLPCAAAPSSRALPRLARPAPTCAPSAHPSPSRNARPAPCPRRRVLPPQLHRHRAATPVPFPPPCRRRVVSAPTSPLRRLHPLSVPASSAYRHGASHARPSPCPAPPVAWPLPSRVTPSKSPWLHLDLV
jgi:hypothetical protein